MSRGNGMRPFCLVERRSNRIYQSGKHAPNIFIHSPLSTRNQRDRNLISFFCLTIFWNLKCPTKQQLNPMSKQKFFTPVLNRKEKPENRGRSQKKEDTLETLSTDMYKQRGSIHNPITPERIKSNPSFSLDKMSTRALEIAKTNLLPSIRKREAVKLPLIKRSGSNPQEQQSQGSMARSKMLGQSQRPKEYYVSQLNRCLRKHQTSYMMNLYRQHFYQQIQVLRFGRSIKIPNARKHIQLSRKNPNFKTIFLDLDQTLIHCDQNSNNYSVKLNFPLQRGGILAAGVRIRPYCREFLQQVSQFAQIIIFTASSSSYADVILDYLDPEKKYISHRMYRQHCTLEKGYYLKDLRVVNRKLHQCVLVDNSPYCHLLQPQNAVPMVPFYHFSKDRQLQHLVQFLRIVVGAQDTRKVVLQTFFWDKYLTEPGQPRRLFLKYHGKIRSNQ